VSQIRTFLLVMVACATAAVGAADAATSPKALRAAILKAELAKQSVHYVTAISQPGQRVWDVADVARDLGIQRFAVFSKSGKTGRLTVLVVHSTAYLHGDAFALHALGFSTSFARYAGKWISFPHNSDMYALIARNVTLGSFARDGVPDFPQSLVRGTVGGRAMTGVRGLAAPLGGILTGGTPEDSILTTYIPVSGPPLPVEVTEVAQGSTGHVTLSRWNEPVRVQAPTHSVPIHL
jgi:hypothetical protein